ncbi:MAG: hypothetical protein QOG64_202 [Acidimicrobiaceae bacterium]|nr:hypothetical protein [Acidimicrobiaceae bacterium]
MELFGRRWDRWDGIVAAAAVMLIVVSRQPWYILHDDASVAVWDARTQWELSLAVTLGLVAAALYLAYRSRPEGLGAAWMALVMLAAALGFVGWHWQRASGPEERATISFRNVPFGETPEQLRRRLDDELAALIANPPPAPTRSTRWGFYFGAGSLILMGIAIARRVVSSRPSRSEAG